MTPPGRLGPVGRLGRLGRLLVLATATTAAVLLSVAAPAQAHPVSTSAVLLDVGSASVDAVVELPLDELSIARAHVYTATNVLDATTLLDLRAYLRAHLSAAASGRAWSTVVEGGRVEKVDGVDNLVLDATLTPASGPVADFVLHDDAIVSELVSHRIFVSGRYGRSGDHTTLAMLSWQTQSVPVAAASPTPDRGFLAAVRLGVHHIASGSDHLLFLVMLLLPAPLIAVGRRWHVRPDAAGLVGVRHSSVRVVHVVTAFAVGHSCTLVLGALGWAHLPTRLVESGIAASVLVSAVHAARPLVRRGEILIAGGFGLLHGLSFAAVLGGLDLDRTSLVTTLLGFNVGIELTQLLVVALVMPSLLLLSRAPAYSWVRNGAAAVGGLLAAGWLASRVGIVSSNPLEPVGDLLVHHPVALALGLGVVSLVVAGLVRIPGARAVRATSGGTLLPARRGTEEVS